MPAQNNPNQYEPTKPTHDQVPGPIEVLVHNWLGTGQPFSMEMRSLPSIPSPTDFPTVRGTIAAGVPGTYDVSYDLAATQWDSWGYLGESVSSLILVQGWTVGDL